MDARFSSVHWWRPFQSVTPFLWNLLSSLDNSSYLPLWWCRPLSLPQPTARELPKSFLGMVFKREDWRVDMMGEVQEEFRPSIGCYRLGVHCSLKLPRIYCHGNGRDLRFYFARLNRRRQWV
jgi:hypothetical protein